SERNAGKRTLQRVPPANSIGRRRADAQIRKYNHVLAITYRIRYGRRMRRFFNIQYFTKRIYTTFLTFIFIPDSIYSMIAGRDKTVVKDKISIKKSSGRKSSC